MARRILKGLTFGYKDGGSPVPVAQIFNVGGLETLVADADFSEMGNEYDYFMATTKSVSDFTFDCHYDPALHDALFAFLGTEKDWYVAYNESILKEFPGFLNKWGLGGGTNKDKATFGGSIKVNGPVDLDP